MAQALDAKADIKGDEKAEIDLPLVNYSLTDRLRDEFKEFGYIRVYGSEENPLFPVIDVAKAIGIKRFRVEEHSNLIAGKHYCRKAIPGVNGRDSVLLTERGLYLAIARSNSKLGEKFMDFVGIVLKELRTKGVVTLTDAVKRFKDELKVANEEKAKLMADLETEHEKFLRQQKDAERYYMKSYELTEAGEALKLEIQALKRQSRLDMQSQIMENIKRKCMKRWFLKLEKPPKEVADAFDYDAKDEDPTNDDEYVFSFHAKEPETQNCEAEIYTFKDASLAKLDEFLKTKGLGIKKEDGTMYHNKYRATIELLQDGVDEFNAKID